MKNFTLLSIVIFIYSCSNASDKKTNIESLNKEITFEKNDSILNNQYEKIHIFKDNKGEVLGNMYATLIKDEIFTSLIITGKTKSDTLYLIEKNTFFNKNGVDFKVNNDKYYGYRIELIKDDYFVLVYLQNSGLNVSDPVTIKWNYIDMVFEKLKIP